ncbi:lyase family protein [Arsenicicoccus sp. oral taxon 190]|uniref:lyase family protein n=1 Tax=Arsenicicoccus sp. oral taxon 190 TaxID=1658671 RepID=UPI00067A3C60|nr:lyase family protein [Arsenicicoccus sp. oral taxon 190]AKT50981.1 hypothetical protein ADJ73_06010 [Arsenicicoccus sp. oral taxon 190]
MTPPVAGDLGLLAPVWAGTPVADRTDDRAVVQRLLDVEHAWLAVCVEVGLAPEAALEGLDQGAGVFAAESYDGPSLARRCPMGGNPLIPLLADLRQQLGDHPAASQVHAGATSQDVLDTALMLLAADVLDAALPELDAALAALVDLAERHRDTIAVARSLGQPSLPTTFGLRAAGWLAGLSAATDELARARAALPLQWGGAAGTRANLVTRLASAGLTVTADEGTALLAGRLALRDVPPWHTDRQVVLRLATAVAGVLAALGTIAADVVTASRPEIGELREPAAPGRGGSSAMPHKRNPVLSVLLRSAALQAPGLLATVALAAGSAVDERPDGAWHAEWSTVRDLLRLLGGAAPKAAELLGGLEVDPAALRANLDRALPDLLSEKRAALPPGQRDQPDALGAPEDYLGQAHELTDRILREHRARAAERPARPAPDRRQHP